MGGKRAMIAVAPARAGSCGTTTLITSGRRCRQPKLEHAGTSGTTSLTCTRSCDTVARSLDGVSAAQPSRLVAALYYRDSSPTVQHSASCWWSAWVQRDFLPTRSAEQLLPPVGVK